VGSRNQRATAQVYQFKLVLVGVEPPVWRRIQVPETYSFWDLHVALQDAMGWLDYHLHVFRMARPGTGEVEQIGIPDDDPFEGEKPTLPGGEIFISRYFPRTGTSAQYEYDFGAGWEHDLTLEAILPRQAGQKYPVCVGGARACPPEDCGGVHGYEDLLTTTQDPAHEEYERILEWLGGRFDPDKFDPKRVKFDNPARRYKLAFEKSTGQSRRGRRTTKPGRRGRKRSRRSPASAADASTEPKTVAGRSEAESSRLSIDEIEARALELDRRGRACLARKLLESLEAPSDADNERRRVEAAERRDADSGSRPPHPHDR
jgi:Plasmid pRiA4b ORF-3-like protein